jgi:hypothetical protein
VTINKVCDCADAPTVFLACARSHFSPPCVSLSSATKVVCVCISQVASRDVAVPVRVRPARLCRSPSCCVARQRGPHADDAGAILWSGLCCGCCRPSDSAVSATVPPAPGHRSCLGFGRAVSASRLLRRRHAVRLPNEHGTTATAAVWRCTGIRFFGRSRCVRCACGLHVDCRYDRPGIGAVVTVRFRCGRSAARLVGAEASRRSALSRLGGR